MHVEPIGDEAVGLVGGFVDPVHGPEDEIDFFALVCDLVALTRDLVRKG